MHSCYFRALRLGGVSTSPQAVPSGLQMTPPSLPGTENPGMPGSPDFILIINSSSTLCTSVQREKYKCTSVQREKYKSVSVTYRAEIFEQLREN